MSPLGKSETKKIMEKSQEGFASKKNLAVPWSAAGSTPSATLTSRLPTPEKKPQPAPYIPAKVVYLDRHIEIVESEDSEEELYTECPELRPEVGPAGYSQNPEMNAYVDPSINSLFSGVCYLLLRICLHEPRLFSHHE